MKIKENDLYKVKRVTVKPLFREKNNSFDSRDVIGVVVPIVEDKRYPGRNDTLHRIILENGEIIDTSHYRIIDVNIVKNRPESIRNTMDEIGKIYKKRNNEIQKMNRIINRFEKEIENIEMEEFEGVSLLKDEYFKEFEVYSSDVFHDKVLNIMDNILEFKQNLENFSNRNPRNRVSISNNSINMDIALYTEECVREGALGVVYGNYGDDLEIDFDEDNHRAIVSKYLKETLGKEYDELMSKAEELMRRYKGITISFKDNLSIEYMNTLEVSLGVEIAYTDRYCENDDLLKIYLMIMRKLLR